MGRCLLFAILVLLLPGCTSVGSASLVRDQTNYSRQAGQAEREELLRGIVSLRYSEIPSFLSLQQVVAGYQVESSVSTRIFPDRLGGSDVGGSARYTDRPTLTYSPLDGSEFYTELVQPIPPGAVFYLLGAGWAPDTIFWASIKSINGISGATEDSVSGVGYEDAEFEQVVELVRKLQKSDALDVRLRTNGDHGNGSNGYATVLWLADVSAREKTKASLQELKELLHLDGSLDRFDLVYGRLGTDGSRILVQTRSIMQTMVLASSYVIVPEDHVEEGRTSPNITNGERSELVTLNIRHATRQPDEAFVATKFRDHWFYIDDRDLESKQTFAVLMLLGMLAQDGQTTPSPVLTIPAG
ncbi:MAG: hypothetical protein AAFR65_00610 [Pseudomonadota bacterium]